MNNFWGIVFAAFFLGANASNIVIGGIDWFTGVGAALSIFAIGCYYFAAKHTPRRNLHAAD